MTQEEKDLLLKDILARLPYGVKVNNEIQGDFEIYGVCENYIYSRSTTNHADFHIEKIKPYLFPMSSMTEEQKKNLFKISGIDSIYGTFYTNSEFTLMETLSGIKWLLENHFDYLGLIEKGLAIDATGLNIY